MADSPVMVADAWVKADIVPPPVSVYAVTPVSAVKDRIVLVVVVEPAVIPAGIGGSVVMLDADTDADAPPALAAVMENVYDAPPVRPVMSIGELVDAVLPPPESVYPVIVPVPVGAVNVSSAVVEVMALTVGDVGAAGSVVMTGAYTGSDVPFAVVAVRANT